MTIIASSDPATLDAANAFALLRDRAVQTSAVCLELDSADRYADLRPRYLLSQLRGWIRDVTGIEYAIPSDGIDDMVVPEGGERLLTEITVGAEVCDALAMYWTADTGVESAHDAELIREALDRWRFARAQRFANIDTTDTTLKWPGTEKHLLYIVEHRELGVRKLGRTSADRLSTWRQRGWSLIDTARFDDVAALAVAESEALARLDKLCARSTSRMGALFANLDTNGRTEMFDPSSYRGGISELLGDPMGQRLVKTVPTVPPWIADRRSAAARKAWQHPNRNGSEAAQRAAATRRRNLEDDAASEVAAAAEPCIRCAIENAAADQLELDTLFHHSDDWQAWSGDMAQLFHQLLAGPVHVVIIQEAGSDHYVQVMLGHHRSLIEVSANTTTDDVSDQPESASNQLRSLGFTAPDKAVAGSSPNWTRDVSDAAPEHLSQVVAACLSGPARTAATDRLLVEAFVIETPCATCAWD